MSEPHRHLFTFAAKGLQHYVLEGGQLKTMVGATEIIDRLCRPEELNKWLDRAGIKAEVLQGAAGSARMLLDSEDDARRLARVWPVFCHAFAPGLEVVQALVPVETGLAAAIQAAEREMRIARNFLPPSLPAATPVMERARRSGKPAVRMDEERDNRVVPIDASAARKIDVRKEIRDTRGRDVPVVFGTCGFKSMNSEDPEDFEAPYKDFEMLVGDDRAYLAVIHADGNGLGQMFMKIGQSARGMSDDEAVQQAFAHLSKEVIEAGTREAVASAVEKTLQWAREEVEILDPQKKTPVLPIVLAGDDVTLVCRADLAWKLTTTLLKEFEDTMKTKLKEFGSKVCPAEFKDAIPSGLTMGAGIVFAAHNYPFTLSYALCESLAKHAKDAAKMRNKDLPPSSVSFHRITGASAPEDFGELLDAVLKGDGVTLTACPYYISEEPRTGDLEQFARFLASEFPRGKVRQLAALLAADAGSVRQSIDRMLQIAGGNNPKRWGGFAEDLGFDRQTLLNPSGFSLLPDALALIQTGSLGRRGKKDTSENKDSRTPQPAKTDA